MDRQKVEQWLKQFEQPDFYVSSLPYANSEPTQESIEQFILYSMWKRAKNKRLFRKAILKVAELIKVEVGNG